MGFLGWTQNQKTAGPTGTTLSLEHYNPYLAARREWDERYGDQITRARNWCIAAFFSALITLVATSGLVWLSIRSRIIPFVVVTDNLGRPVASGLADQASTADEQLKRSTVIEWVENLRLVTTDGVAQRRAIDRVYAHIASGSPAQTFISDFYRNNQPFTKAETETVFVDVQSVLQDSEETFEVEWTETIRDLYGAAKEAALEGRFHDSHKPAERRRPGPRQPPRDLRNPSQLVQSSLKEHEAV